MNPAIAKRKDMVEWLGHLIPNTNDMLAETLLKEAISEIRDHLSGVCVWNEEGRGFTRCWVPGCDFKSKFTLYGILSPLEHGIEYCGGCSKPIEEKPYTQEGGK